MASYKSQTILRGITSSEFGDFLNEKGISAQCPICDHASAINVSGSETDVAVLVYPTAKIEPNGQFNADTGKGLATVSISCRNCGYMRNFSLTPIVDWLNEKQKTALKNDEQ